MTNVIQVKETSQWFDANLLKASIAWMKQRNDGRFTQAIEDEENLLRSFFKQIRAQGEAATCHKAA